MNVENYDWLTITLLQKLSTLMIILVVGIYYFLENDSAGAMVVQNLSTSSILKSAKTFNNDCLRFRIGICKVRLILYYCSKFSNYVT